MSRLLIIDDERDFGEFVAKIGTMVGFETTVTDTVADFRQAVSDPCSRVIVLDLNMPDVDGIELLRELAEAGSTAKLVLASGIDRRTLEAARRLGRELGLTIAGAIQKPVRAAELKALLSSLREATEAVCPESLKTAIDNDHLFLAYQPKIDVASRRMIGVEALVRWRDDMGRTIFPDSFVPLAEKSGLINDLTAWVTEHATRQAGQWHAEGLDLKVAINLSASNIHDRRLPDRLAARCQEVQLPPEAVILELTETASMQNATLLLEILGRFRIKGFGLSIDDFGTGYSSVAQLLKLPFSELKIDKSFVIDMDRARDSAIITKTLIEMARNLGLSVVAEGVESEAVFALLTEHGCNMVQGYHFSKPVDPERIKTMIKAPSR